MKERRDEFQHLRKQLEDFEYEVPANGWKEMSAILNGQRPVPQPAVPENPRRRFAGWFWLAGALLLAGGGALLWGQQTAFHIRETVLLSALPVPFPEQPQPVLDDITAKAVASTEERTSGKEGPASAPPRTPSSGAPGKEMASSHPQSRVPAPLITDRSEQPADTTASDLNSLVPAATAPDTSADRRTDQVFAGLAPISTLPAELLQDLPATPALPEITSPNLRRLSFGLKAGADYQSLQTNALLGVFAQFRLQRKWVLEAGLQYKRRSENNSRGLGIPPPPGDTIYLPAFASVAPYHRAITRVHFLEAPVTLQYQIANRLWITGGMQVAHLRSTDQPVGNQNDDSSRAALENAADFSLAGAAVANSGNAVRFEQWDLGLIAGIDYRIASHWSAELRWQQGLRDLTPDSYYQNEERYNNSSLQLALKWYW